jgi:hypothetical protein
MFLVTIADKSHLTTDQPQQINLSRIKRRLGAGLEACRITGIFWFGALPRNGLQNIWQKIKSRFTPIMPGLCAVHKKIIPRDQFGYKLWYILKSPCKEYSIGQRRERDEKTGAAKFKQNSRKLRPGNRVKLFYLMREVYWINWRWPVAKVENCCGELNTLRPIL